MTDTQTSSPGAAPTTHRTERLTIITPADWTVLPLDPKTRDRRIAGIVEHRIGKEDRHAYLRRQYIVQLRKSAAEAAAKGAFFAAMHSTAAPNGAPLSASAMASMVPQATDAAGNPLNDAEAMARVLATGGEGQVLEHSVVDLQVGPAARVRRRAGTGIRVTDDQELLGENVQYYVPLPEVGKTLALLFATPILDLADEYTALFDVMALSASWVRATPETEAGS